MYSQFDWEKSLRTFNKNEIKIIIIIVYIITKFKRNNICNDIQNKSKHHNAQISQHMFIYNQHGSEHVNLPQLKINPTTQPQYYSIQWHRYSRIICINGCYIVSVHNMFNIQVIVLFRNTIQNSSICYFSYWIDVLVLKWNSISNRVRSWVYSVSYGYDYCVWIIKLQW